MTDTDGLLRDAGGARPRDELDALIERLLKFCKVADSCPECALDRAEAAAALVQLRIQRDNLQGSRDYSMDLLLKYLGMDQGPIEYLTRTVIARAERAEAEVARLTVEFRKVEVLWKEAAIDASRMYDTICGLENACRISLSRIDALQAENKLLRECARTPDLERIDAAIDAAKEKP